MQRSEWCVHVGVSIFMGGLASLRSPELFPPTGESWGRRELWTGCWEAGMSLWPPRGRVTFRHLPLGLSICL